MKTSLRNTMKNAQKCVSIISTLMVTNSLVYAQTYRFDFEGWGTVSASTKSVTQTSLVPISTSSGAKILDLRDMSQRSVMGPSTQMGTVRITALSNNGTAAGKKGNDFFYELPNGDAASFQFLGIGTTGTVNAVTDRLEFGGNSYQGGLGYWGPAYQTGPLEPGQSLQAGLYGGHFQTHGAGVTDLRQNLGDSTSGLAVGVAHTNAADGYRKYLFKRKVQSAMGGEGDTISTRLSEPVPGAGPYELGYAKVNSRGDILVSVRDAYFVNPDGAWHSKVFWADGTQTELSFVGTGINQWGQIVGFDSQTLDYKVMTGSSTVSLRDAVSDNLGLDFRRRNQGMYLLDISDEGWVVGQSQLVGSANNSSTMWFATRVNPVPEPATMVILGIGGATLVRRSLKTRSKPIN